MTCGLQTIGRWLVKAQQDRGAALVTVMLLVSVMAAGAVVTFDQLGYTVKRTTARKMFDQAKYYALGGEQLALSAAEKLTRAKVRLSKPKAVSYPVDGGRIEGLIRDGSNCFNVNSLVERSDGAMYRINAKSALQFGRLLELLGLSERDATALTNALIDWLDSDNRPLPMGAEDYDYAGLAVPYRAANTLLADLSELRLVQGYTAEVLELVRPYLCASDNNAETVLNVNTLEVANAPLLAAVIGGDFSVGAAADLIASRPAGGYSDIADFYFERGFEGRSVEQAIRRQTAVKPQRFVSQIRVRFHEGMARLTSEIRMDDDGVAYLVRHRFGVFQ